MHTHTHTPTYTCTCTHTTHTPFHFTSVLAFMLHGKLLPNNSAVSLADIGTDEDALLCLTDYGSTLSGFGMGEWYFPNQTTVRSPSYALFRHETTMYRNRGDGIVLLHRLSRGVEGIYRCEIPDSNWQLQSLFVRVYSLHQGISLYAYTVLSSLLLSTLNWL